MKKILLLFLIIPTLAFPVTLEKVMKLARSNNSELLSLQNQLKIKRWNIKILGFQTIPSLTLDFNANVVSESKTQSHSFSFGLNYPLIDGGERNILLKLTRTEIERLAIEYAMKKQDLEYRVKKAFYNIILFKNIRGIYEKAMSQAVLELRTSEEKFKEGMIDSLTLESARQFYLDAEYQLIRSENSIKSMRNDLTILIGASFTGETEGRLEKEGYRSLNRDIRLHKLDMDMKILRLTLQKELVANDWTLSLFSSGNMSWQQGAENGNYQLRAGVNIYFPLNDFLSLHGNASHTIQTLPSSSYNAGVNLFDQNNSSFLKKSAHLTIALEKKKILDEKRRITEENKNIGNKLLELGIAVQISSNKIKLQKLNYEKIKTLYQSGGKTAKDVLDARLSLLQSRTDYERNLYTYDSYLWRLDSLRDHGE